MASYVFTESNKRLIAYIKKHMTSIAYVSIAISVALISIIESNFSISALVIMLIFIGCMFTAKFYVTKKLNKYILAVLSFALFAFLVYFDSLSYTYTTAINKWTLLLMNYMLLLDGFVFSIIGALYLIINLLLLLPDSLKGGEIPLGQIMGNITGTTMSILLMSSLYYLIGKLIIQRDRFHKLSITDSLTGVATLAHTIVSAREMIKNYPISLLITDMDRFKQVNDTYGHVVGNKVLIEVADLIRKETEGLERVIGRLGGDEFIIVVRNDGSKRVLELCNRLLNVMQEKTFVVDPELDPIKLSFSVGQANSVSKDDYVENLLHAADVNMYFNKYHSHRLNISLDDEKLILPQEGYELLNVLAEKDMYTYVHSANTAHYAAMLAKELGFSKQKVEAVYAAGWLHDIGKILISNDILRKKGKLSDGEYDLIKNHVTYSINILKDFNLSEVTMNCIKYHHECWNGTGYPNKVSGEDIPVEARIIQIVDSYSAMIIKRVYRKKLLQEDALREILKSSGAQFDPHIARVFCDVIRGKAQAI